MAKSDRHQEFPLGPRPAGMPLHRWLHAELRRAIVEGRLKPGTRLPSTRSLAAQQGVARATVVAVFEQLQAEGYLAGRTGSGTVVVHELPDRFLAAAKPAPAIPRVVPMPPPLDPGQRSRVFSVCEPDSGTFPLALWTQLVARRLRLSGAALFERGDARGYRPLREAVAAYLRTARSVQCDVEQVVIVNGTQQALDFIARLTLGPDAPVWFENPGYPGAAGAFRAVGAKLVPVPVDAQGFDVAAAIRREPAPRLAYVTPGHQFPLGVTLSLKRQLALLEYADRHGFHIFEDDYDGEYRYDVRPLGALQGHDRRGRVIYVGSFNKLVFAALRLGYMVLPPRLVGPFLALRDCVDRYPPTLEQAVLADFFREGHFERHLRRSRNIYLERRDALLAAAAQHLHGLLDLQESPAGFNLVGWLPDAVPAIRAQARAAEHNVQVTPLSSYYIGKPVRNGLLLGYGSAKPRAITAGVERLARALASLRPANRAGRRSQTSISPRR
jgi:GntR family transcriptional regulator/MocR family aminotransferase